MFAVIKQQYPDWQSRFAAGNIGFVRQWLCEHVWQQGSMLESQELMLAATGEQSNAGYLLEHLEARYLRAEY
jgi:carboxypeptidase Taq